MDTGGAADPLVVLGWGLVSRAASPDWGLTPLWGPGLGAALPGFDVAADDNRW